jgi:hypothetical protein
LAALGGDSKEIQSRQEAYAEVDSIGETSSFLRWRAASALGDEDTLAEVQAAFPELDGSSLNRIIGLGQLFDTSLESADLAASILARRVGTITERWEWLLGLHSLALNRGRPQEASALIREWAEVEGSPRESLRIRVLDGLYWDGNLEVASAAVDTLMSSMDSLSASEGDPGETYLANLCVVEQWRLGQGDTRSASRSLARFRASADERRVDALPLRHAVCASGIEALLAMAEDRVEAEEAVQRLDRLLLLVPDVETGDDPSLVGPFIVARWKESQGDVAGALSAMRRWHNHWFTGVRYLSTYLREQGRLAALVGETEEAEEAYRHYLMLRDNPESGLVGERDSIGARLAELLALDTGN